MYLFVVKDNSQINERKLRRDIGSSAFFTCNSYHDTSWCYKGKMIIGTVDISLINGSLIINRLTTRNYGSYTCFGTYNHLKNYYYANAILMVYGKYHFNRTYRSLF